MPSPSRVGRRLDPPRDERRRVVLEPGQAPRAVEPDAAQEADLADRRADVGREPRARRQHEQHVARPARADSRRDEHDRARRRPTPKIAQRERVPARARPARAPPPARTSAPTPRAGRATSRGPMPRDAHLLAGRRGGGRREEVRAPAGSPEAPRSSAARSTPGRQVEVSTVGSAKSASSASAGMDRHQQRRASRPAAGSSRRSRTATCTCGRARTPGCAAPRAGRGTRAAPGARSSRPTACSRATCDSSAIVTLSRKRRCMRVLTVRRNQVAVADTPSPRAAASSRRSVARAARRRPGA